MGKVHPSQITADVLKALHPECLENLARSLSVMCWDMNFPEEWLCSFDSCKLRKVVGATCLSKFRPIAALCAKNPGHTVAQITPFTATQECAGGVRAENSRRCWFVLVAVSGRTITRNCGGAAGCEKRHRDHEDHRAAFKAMRLQSLSPFSMALIAAPWNGSCMKARLETVISNKVQMNLGLQQGVPESPVIFTVIMELVLSDFIKSWNTRPRRLCAGCDLLCGRCGFGSSVNCCCGSDVWQR